ncbi:MAG: nucleoid-associated protein [Anaerolineae bacterium]|jgi:hypothetical protein
MNHRFRLNHLALHYIGFRPIEPKEEGASTKEKWQQQATKLQEIPALDEAIIGHLVALIEDTWDSPDAGAVHSARFEPEPADPARTQVQTYLKDIKEKVWTRSRGDLQAGKDFLELSQKIDDRLYDCTTLAASPGLLMVADFSPANQDSHHLALLKIRHTDERFITILQDSLTDLGVQDVEMMLTREILKGAIWPHPTRPEYDLKLIDRQARVASQPARYFTEEFLGCQAKDSDARQAAELSASMPRSLAKKHGWKLDVEQTDDYVVELIEKTQPTAEAVAQAAANTELVKGAEPDQLRAAVEAELGDRLPDVLSAEQLEPDLEAVALERGWRYRPERQREFRVEMDRVLRLDEDKVTDALVKTGLLKDAETKTVNRSLKEIGGVDVPRQTLIMRTKTKRRLLRYHFDVPRRPDSREFVRVTISGPPETVRRFLTQEEGENYVFSIETAPAGFRREYK